MNQMHLKKIMGNVSVLNVLLLAVLVIFAANILPPLLNVNVSYTLPTAKKTAEQKQEGPAAEAQAPPAIEYTIVAEQNLFHPERKIPAEKKEEKPLPKPEFVLYGTMVSSDASLAFMEDRKAPLSTGRGKRQQTLKQGGSLSGFILSQVQEDRVIMTRGDEKIEVRVLNPTRAKSQAEAAPTAATGTQAAPIQPAPGSAGAVPRAPARRTVRTGTPPQQ
jgi:type II secretory pathway component PulC